MRLAFSDDSDDSGWPCGTHPPQVILSMTCFSWEASLILGWVYSLGTWAPWKNRSADVDISGFGYPVFLWLGYLLICIVTLKHVRKKIPYKPEVGCVTQQSLKYGTDCNEAVVVFRSSKKPTFQAIPAFQVSTEIWCYSDRPVTDRAVLTCSQSFDTPAFKRFLAPAWIKESG